MDNSLLAVRDINHKYIVVERRDFVPKQKKRRLADYSTSEMVKLCGMKASSTFENKRDKVFERYEIY